MRRMSLAILLFMALFLMWLTNVSAAPFAYIANQGDNTVSVINTATNTVVNVIGGMDNQPYPVVVSPDGSRVYVACRIDGAAGGTVVVLDTATNSRLLPSINVGGDPQGIAIHPNGEFVYVGRSRQVSIINTTTNTVVDAVLTTPSKPDTVYGIAVHPNGDFVYAAVPAHNTIYVIATGSNTIITGIPVGLGPERVVISPDGTHLYVTNTRGLTASDTVSVVSTDTNTEIATIPVGDAPNGIDIHPTEATVYVANSNSDNVSVIDTLSHTVTTVPVGDEPLGISVHPAGTAVYVVNAQDDTVSVIDTASLMVSVPIPVGDAPASLGRFITPAVDEALTIDIDIKPGADPNCFNIDGHGVIPVAILGSEDFDVTQIDTGSLVFEGLDVGLRGNNSPQCSVDDVSSPDGTPDGTPDLVCQFVDDPDAWSAGDDTATLTGNLLDGTQFEGSDSVCIVPPGN